MVELNYDITGDMEWVRTAAIVIAFVAAFGIGANDVANAYATSVGAKALTINQAIILAAIFEFLGAFTMGQRVTDTIRKGIVNPDAFNETPEILMIGMLSALTSVTFWLLLASALEMPVSTTHSIIGAILGFGMVLPQSFEDNIVNEWKDTVKVLCDAGSDEVDEEDCEEPQLIIWSKVISVVFSWFLSPVASGILAAALYLFVRSAILRQENSLSRAWTFYPMLIAFTIGVNAYYIMAKGAKDLAITKSLDGEFIEGAFGWELKGHLNTAIISILIGIASGILLTFTIVPIFKKKIDEMDFEKELAEKSDDVESAGASQIGSLNYDVHEVLKDKEGKVSKMHERAEVFDPATEKVFSYLQVFTAIFDSFAHGANDVANSIGPLAAVVNIYDAQSLDLAEKSGKQEVPLWIFALGGAGIVVGLATYGYKIISAIGVKLIKITPSRGFSIELGAAFVIITGAAFSWPLSTTHCQVGATVGVGVLEGKGGINWLLFAQVFFGWVITLVIAGAVSAGLFAFAVYSPTLLEGTTCA